MATTANLEVNPNKIKTGKEMVIRLTRKVKPHQAPPYCNSRPRICSIRAESSMLSK